MTGPIRPAALDQPGGWAPDVTMAGPEWAEASPEQQAAAVTWGTHLVWALSGRVYGLARVVVAPWIPPVLPWTNTPQLAGLVGALRIEPRPTPYSTWDRARRIALPGPVQRVLSVVCEGAEMVEGTDWTLEPVTGRLGRTSGVWPMQDLMRPMFTVTYVRGNAVPAAANLAAGIYAAEWLKAMVGSGACRLPERTRTVARSGVTATMVAPETLANAGLTGIGEVDAFISAVNPARALPNGRGFTRQVTPSLLWTPELASHRILEVGPA